MTEQRDAPSWRKPAGMFMILGLIAVWAILILALTPIVMDMAWPLQAVFFTIAGTVWILPLKPLLRWMETGRFR
jgi:membrane protein implicated in regulation of membrane protease activity